MARHLLRLSPVLFATAALVIGCAEPVDDIDRTQGNLIRKSDIDGEWYMMQTITEVPPTSSWSFVGETGRTERIRWEVQEALLVAYRSYPLVPGAESPSSPEQFDGKDNPVAAYEILGHFDIIRDYNESTGEQSNVIREDESDRLWWQREYMRVDWSLNQITNFEFVSPTTSSANIAYFVQEEQGGPDAFYKERVDPEEPDSPLGYFDILGKISVEPDFWGCVYMWYGLSAEDCTAAEIGVRTSFARVPAERRYESFHYDDQMLGRFGFFRTERFTFDEQRGVRDSGRRYMINRHDIWARGLDDEGNTIPIPEREQRTVAYYLGENFPDDELLRDAAFESIAQWNVAGKRAVAAAQGKSIDEVDDVFVLCNNPTEASDHEGCARFPALKRIGDLRFSVVHWVDTETLTGLLGYGPSATDPITGEIIAGKAYTYGAAVNTYASYAIDIVRYFNEDIGADALIHGDHYFEDMLARLEGKPSYEPASPKLDRIAVDRNIHAHGRPKRPSRPLRDVKRYDAQRVQNRMDAAREAGHTPMLLTDEVKRALSSRTGRPWDALTDDEQDALDPSRTLNPLALGRARALRRAARARSVDMIDMIEPSIQGLVRSYLGRDDYDQMWHELRAEVFAATMEHEIGHTLGLRHNFQGSYDSLNFFDEYWDLRTETLEPIERLGDFYTQAGLTQTQHEGMMRQKQYSSIMDYGYSFANDLNGLGKYDEAALVFGYTAGTYEAEGRRCGQYPSDSSDGDDETCLAKLPGFVEVFEKGKDELGRAGEMLSVREQGYWYEDSGLPSIHALERYHYTTLANAFPSVDDMLSRRLISYADYVDARSADGGGRPVRVPYMFCSDEWESTLISCRAFDQGADPFELTRAKIDQYRAYYHFVNFRRDRVWFDVWDPLFSYFDRVFLPISDYFQSWYVAPFGNDPVMDRSYDLAINSGFNLIAETLSTPSYGQYCETVEGRLYHLSDDPTLQGNPTDQSTRCAEGGRVVELAPGVGRRTFSRYEAQEGYYLEYKPLEAGHYWATLAALWAMLDPEAYIIGVEGDAGVYAISFYDWFADEMDGFFNQMLADDFPSFAPVAIPGEKAEDTRLRYRVPAPIFDRDTGETFDPETGAPAEVEPADGEWMPTVEAETTFSLATDILWYGMLFTTASYSTRFNDQMHVFRLGSGEQVGVEPGQSELITFTDPLRGVTYAAVQPRCDPRAAGGHVGLCGVCEAPEDCTGFIGFLGGVFCQPVGNSPLDPNFYCLQDCTDDASLCSDGTTCDADGNCVPDDLSCRGVDTGCSPENPFGSCPEGLACSAGICGPPATFQCQFLSNDDTGAATLVRRGASLAGAYDAALESWYTFFPETPEDEAEDTRRARAFFLAQFQLQSHLDLLETVIATYDIFGKVY